jgi:hypothetical protein
MQAVDGLDNLINSQLTVGSPGGSNDPSQIFCDSASAQSTGASTSCAAYHQAWSSMRDIALGLMVIAGIVTLTAQALGFEILDAYTIRKVLPRLLIAAVAITLSWQLMQFFVKMTNDLGYGIRFLIYQPFAGLHSPVLGSSTTALATLPLLIGVTAYGFVGLLSFMMTAALAVLVGFIVLLLRQLIIIMMIIIAPIAIVAYIMPNTQRMYKMWWESFSKALLMFALISGLIATGRVFSVVAGLNSSSPLDQLVSFVAYFLPYLLLPATFKYAGSALQGASNLVNSRAQGGFEKLRKGRQESTAARIQAAKKGGIYRNNFGGFKLRPGGKQRYLSNMANTFGNYTLDWKDGWRNAAATKGGWGGDKLFGRGYRIRKGTIEDQTDEHSIKAAQQLQLHYQAGRAMGGQFRYFTPGLDTASVNALNDRFGIKDKHGKFTGSYRNLETEHDMNDAADILQNGGEGAREAASELRAKAPIVSSLKGAGKWEAGTQRANVGLTGMVSAAQAGRLDNRDIVDNHNRLVMAGHVDEAYKQTALLQKTSEQKRPMLARGHGIAFNSQGVAYSVYDNPAGEEAQKSLARISTTDVANAKSEDLDETRDTWIAGASVYKMKQEKVANSDGTFSYNMVVDKGPDGKSEPVMKTGDEYDRALQIQARIKTMATYNYGDSDVGRKLKNIWTAADLPADALDMRGGGVDVLGAAGPVAHPPDPEPPAA